MIQTVILTLPLPAAVFPLRWSLLLRFLHWKYAGWYLIHSYRNLYCSQTPSSALYYICVSQLQWPFIARLFASVQPHRARVSLISSSFYLKIVHSFSLLLSIHTLRVSSYPHSSIYSSWSPHTPSIHLFHNVCIYLSCILTLQVCAPHITVCTIQLLFYTQTYTWSIASTPFPSVPP